MAWFNLRRWLGSVVRPKGRPHRRNQSRLNVEALEARLAPATFRWDGGAGAGDSRWSTGLNWVGDAAPTGSAATLDDLVFPSGVPSTNTVNDITAGVFNSITI